MGQAQHGAGHFSGSGIFTGFNSEGNYDNFCHDLEKLTWFINENDSLH